MKASTTPEQGFFYRGGGGHCPPLNWSKSGICIRRHNSMRRIRKNWTFFSVKSDKSGPFFGLA